MSVSITITLDDGQVEAIAVRVSQMLADRPADPGEDVVTVAEAAARMRVSEKTIRRAIADGRLPAIRIGRAVRVAPSDLAAVRIPRRDTSPSLARRARLLQPGREFTAMARGRKVGE